MMYAESFNSSNYDDMASWLKARNAYVPKLEDMPAIGAIVCERGTPIAAGFLRKCEGNIALFDGLVTNPDAESYQRNAALDLLVSQLIKTAKELELKGIIGWSRDELVLLRSYRHGFKQLPDAVIALDLSIQESK